ncbi:uncharacterized protein A1O9_06222 [Exophiala aquamarina CBS 119918]|uniref:Uncharacterized protein n=1 Tax=Exophiala aquamarina CBS 119918 TaxID=1182545 RepID=A0A072PEP5_9EURO|nr:uncharacterized protein A1O9_06222 [Exophiala aquamarina CBS 119918]KEF58296.1 hypothetical protein A1O9_06222 [Exophiala aquamarina CBS 119918]
MAEKTWLKLKRNQRMLASAVVCNPTLVLYSINKVLSIFRPTYLLDPAFDAWVDPLLDVHAHDRSCKVFVLLMVALQIVLYVPRTPDVGTTRIRGKESPEAPNAICCHDD